MKTGIKIKGKGLSDIQKTFDILQSHSVVVGIPESSSRRDDGQVTNAMIGRINEDGSPLNNIPPRPHLVPAVEGVQDRVSNILERASRNSLDGNYESAINGLNAAGIVASNSVKRYITTSNFTPLSPSTLNNRKTRKIAPRQGERPLIDTGEYRRSITYEVRRNET